jgi:AcrR family transcriptional regulator
MRALAKELDVAAPSLYWHFRTREELVAEIVRDMVADIEVAAPEGDWSDQIRVHAHSVRRSVFERPELLDLLRDVASATAELASLGLRFLSVLQEAGFEEEESVRGARLLNWQVWGFILHEARLGWSHAKVNGQIQPHIYEFPMATLSGEDLDQVSHLLPHLARLDADELFQLALESVITTISAFKAHAAS